MTTLFKKVLSNWQAIAAAIMAVFLIYDNVSERIPDSMVPATRGTMREHVQQKIVPLEEKDTVLEKALLAVIESKKKNDENWAVRNISHWWSKVCQPDNTAVDEAFYKKKLDLEHADYFNATESYEPRYGKTKDEMCN